MVNKVHCAYCNKELERLVFCNASHKVMYHRKGSVEQSPSKTIHKPKQVHNKVVQDIKPCRHGLLFCTQCSR